MLLHTMMFTRSNTCSACEIRPSVSARLLPEASRLAMHGLFKRCGNARTRDLVDDNVAAAAAADDDDAGRIFEVETSCEAIELDRLILYGAQVDFSNPFWFHCLILRSNK